MPPVIAAVSAIVSGISAFAAGNVLAGLLVKLAVNFAVSFAIGAIFGRKDNGFTAEARDRTQLVRSSIQPRNIVYGKAVTSGPLIFAGSSDKGDSKNQYLHLVIALAGHECEAIEEIYLGDDALGPLNAAGYPTSGKYYKTTTATRTVTLFVAGGATSLPLPEDFSGVISVTYSGPNESGDYAAFGTVNGYSIAGGTLSFPAFAGDVRLHLNYTTSSGSGLVRVKKHLGSADQLADADLVAEMPAQWTENHRLRGVCYLYIRFEYDAEVFASGLPNVKALVKGAKVYDPRTGATAWSDNWALCINDYLRRADGLGCEAEDVDSLSVIAAANISDEAVPIEGGSQPRYRCNGVVLTDRAPDDNLRQLATAGGGPVPVLAGGIFRVFAGVYDAPTVTLTDSDLRGPIKVRPRHSRRDLFNAVKGTYIDGGNTWQPVDFPIVRNATYAAQDGGEIAKDTELPFTTEPVMAQRLAKIALERARQGITVEYPAKITAFRLAAWDTVKLNSDKFGWSGKVFRVLSWKFDPSSGGVDLVLGEESPDAYSWNMGEATIVDPAPDTNLPPAGYVPPLGPLTVASGDAYLLLLQDGTVVPRLFVSWTTSAAGLWRQGGTIELEYKRDEESIWQSAAPVPGEATSAYITPVIAGAWYNVRARLRSSSGFYSDWSYSVDGAGGSTTPPPPVTFLTTESIIFGIVLRWNFPAGRVDLQRTELWYSQTPSRDNAIKLGDFAYPQNTHTMMGLAAGAEFWFWARLVDTSGNVGEFYPAGAGVHGQASDDANPILGYIAGQIGASELGAELRAKIEAGDDIDAVKDLLGSAQIAAMIAADKAIIATAERSAAALLLEQTVRADETGALAQQVQTAIAASEAGVAVAEDAMTAVSETNGKLAAMRTIKTQVTSGGRTVMAGIAIGVEGEGGDLESQILMYAQRFAILDEANGTFYVPFVVQGGQMIVNSALIGAATIGAAKFVDWLESDAKNAVSGQPVLRINFRTGEIQQNGSGDGARVDRDNNGDRVYDSNGTLRLRLGVW